MAKTNKNASKINRKTKKVETPITIANYQKLAMRTCLPACECWAYAHSELISEICEFFSKHYGFYAKGVRGDFHLPLGIKNHTKILKEIKKELGDVAWSLALYCKIGGYNFCEELKNAQKTAKKAKTIEEVANTKLMLYAYVHKTISEVMLNRTGQIITMKGAFRILVAFCRFYNFKVSDVLRDNIRKLASRQKRGVIMGNGDNR